MKFFLLLLSFLILSCKTTPTKIKGIYHYRSEFGVGGKTYSFSNRKFKMYSGGCVTRGFGKGTIRTFEDSLVLTYKKYIYSYGRRPGLKEKISIKELDPSTKRRVGFYHSEYSKFGFYKEYKIHQISARIGYKLRKIEIRREERLEKKEAKN